MTKIPPDQQGQIIFVSVDKESETVTMVMDNRAMAMVSASFNREIQAWEQIQNPDEGDKKKMEKYKELKRSIEECRDRIL